MVEDILKAVDEKAKEQINVIVQEKEKALFALEQYYGLAIKEKQKEQKDLAFNKIAKEIEDFEKNFQVKISFRTQEEKNNLIKEIYSEAQNKISNLGDPEFKKFIKQMLSHLPQKKGCIEAGKRTADILKGFVDKEIKVEASLLEEGFIFKSNDVEIDFRISQVLLGMEEKISPELIKMLFS